MAAAVGLVNNHNNLNNFPNGLKRVPTAPTTGNASIMQPTSTASAASYQHLYDMNTRITEKLLSSSTNESSKLLNIGDFDAITPTISNEEESRLIDLALGSHENNSESISHNNKKPVLGRLPKSNSFDSPMNLTLPKTKNAKSKKQAYSSSSNSSSSSKDKVKANNHNNYGSRCHDESQLYKITSTIPTAKASVTTNTNTNTSANTSGGAARSTCRTESESDNEYTLMLDKSFTHYNYNYSGNNDQSDIDINQDNHDIVNINGPYYGQHSKANDSNTFLYNYQSTDLPNLQMNFTFTASSNPTLANATASSATTTSTKTTPLLASSNATTSALSPTSANATYVTLRKSPRSLSRAKTTCCFRFHSNLKSFTRTSYLNYLIPFLILIGLIIGAYLTKDYAKRLFFWVETQNPWITFSLFLAFFVLVSFPVVVGYFALLVTAGYLFGWLKGILTVVLGANLGVAIAHLTLRSLRQFFPTQKLTKNDTARAILRVISGPRAFKVVLFTRLTPIPFGLQNAIFGISTINGRIYHIASFLGLLPAQFINVYLGSTLRSMQEVLSNNGTSVMGYISIGAEIICGAALMCWVIQKAKKELSETLISDLNENKDLDIEV